MPEPPDRDAWEDHREVFAFELLEMLENPYCEVFFSDEAGRNHPARSRQQLLQRVLHCRHALVGRQFEDLQIPLVRIAAGALQMIVSRAVNQRWKQLLAPPVARKRPCLRSKWPIKCRKSITAPRSPRESGSRATSRVPANKTISFSPICASSFFPISLHGTEYTILLTRIALSFLTLTISSR